MSVRGLVTVVIGVIFRNGAPLKQFEGNQTPLIQGNLSREQRYGNPELAEANSFGQVQRRYTGHPNGVKRESMPIGNYGVIMRSLRGELTIAT